MLSELFICYSHYCLLYSYAAEGKGLGKRLGKETWTKQKPEAGESTNNEKVPRKIGLENGDNIGPALRAGMMKSTLNP